MDRTVPLGSMLAPFGSMLAPFRDAWLAGRARLAILASTAEGGNVSVEAYYGSVQLSGDVSTPQARHEVERVVCAVTGVGVSNRIRVRGEHAARVATSDADVCTAVTSALAAAWKLRGSRIYVDAVYDRVVTLAGTARSAAARTAAFEIAIHVPGVRRVVCDVAVSSTADVGRRADAA